jgi:two-component system, cell cycle response regulator
METATRILVIEDDRSSVDLMCYLLEAFGYNPFTAMDGEAGLQAVHRDRPELILCDIDLPKLDGFQVVRTLKSEGEFSQLPIVAVTALAMVGDRDKILKAGFDGYISKPIRPETFIDEMECFMAPGLRADRTPIPVTDTIGLSAVSVVEKGVTILVVDDLLDNLSLARNVLEPFGYHVLTASNVPDAVKLAQSHETHLIVCDLIMRQATGYDLLDQVRAIPRLSEIPFALISSTHTDEKYRIEAGKRGVDCFFVRPMEPQVFLTKIEAILESTRKANACQKGHGTT